MAGESADMADAASNDGRMVDVAYRVLSEDGTVVMDQTNSPITFPCIDGWAPPVLVDTVRTMAVGETRRARASAEDAYEKRRADRMLEMPRTDLPDNDAFVVGAVVHLEDEDGGTTVGRIVELDEERVVFDLNRAAVSKALEFEITLLAVHDLPQR